MPTDQEWLQRLDTRLAEQRKDSQIYMDYYNGVHRLEFATEKFEQSFGALFPTFADNWCRTVVDAPVERLGIIGFRFGSDQRADRDAWKIWQASNLDANSIIAHTEAVKAKQAFLLVSPNGPSGEPRITVEHPNQVAVETAPGDPDRRVAALKRWRGFEGREMATLYLPDRIVKFQSPHALPSLAPDNEMSLLAAGGAWELRDGSGAHPFGEVPVIPLLNNPDMFGNGQSDLESAIPLQDAINKELMDMLVASEFAAFRQRVLIGVEIPTIELNGRTIPDPEWEMRTSVQRLMSIEDPNASIAEFAPTDLSNYTNAKDSLLADLAAQTRTPPHYLLGKIVNASGDALKAAETGLVAKTKRKQVDFSEPWEKAMRLAFRAKGDMAKAEALDAETIWRDPEYRSFGELVDGLTKLAALGVHEDIILERAGFTHQEIDRNRALKEADGLLAEALVPTGPPVAGPPAFT